MPWFRTMWVEARAVIAGWKAQMMQDMDEQERVEFEARVARMAEIASEELGKRT